MPPSTEQPSSPKPHEQSDNIKNTLSNNILETEKLSKENKEEAKIILKSKENEKTLNKKKKPKKNRCAYCKKKVGLLGMNCKCNKLFCTLHYHPEAHQCTFDHKTHNRAILESKLVKIDREKMPSI